MFAVERLKFPPLVGSVITTWVTRLHPVNCHSERFIFKLFFSSPFFDEINQMKSWNISIKKEVRRSNYWTFLCSQLSCLSVSPSFSRLCLYCRRVPVDLVCSHGGKLPSVKRFQKQPAVLVVDTADEEKKEEKFEQIQVRINNACLYTQTNQHFSG